MRYRVQVAQAVHDKIANRYGSERSVDGMPSRDDFVQRPLAAAVLQFQQFDALPEEAGPAIRHCHVVAPGFPPIVFMAVLVGTDVVEVASFDDDPDYWDLIGDDPSA